MEIVAWINGTLTELMKNNNTTKQTAIPVLKIAIICAIRISLLSGMDGIKDAK